MKQRKVRTLKDGRQQTTISDGVWTITATVPTPKEQPKRKRKR